MNFSSNEWDPLKKVIVGITDDAKIPEADISLRVVNYADKEEDFKIRTGLYPQQVIDESNEDVEIFCDFLKKENIEVLRPDKKYVPNYYNYCPRDTVLIVEDKAIVTPNALAARVGEWKASSEHLKPFKNIVAPEPDRTKLYNIGCLGDPEVLALNETDPCFDAANVLRANDDLYYLVSNSGNKKGAKYLQTLFPNKKVHTIEKVYSYMHLDSTIALLREGLVLCNPKRIKSEEMLPKPLQSWEIIYAPEPVDIGYYPGYCNSSPWINVNLLSINPNLVVIEEHQTELAKLLDKYNIDSAMLPLRHARTLGGCFHCITLDLHRAS